MVTINQPTRHCTRCRETKPSDAFRAGKNECYCRSCRSALEKAYRQKPANKTPAKGRVSGVGSGELVLLDDDRTPTRAGDTVCFNYGTPPVAVRARIIKRGGSLIALTPGHTPAECNLRSLRRYVGGWFKQNVQDQRRPAND